jgi:hypothetical protein
MLSCIFLLAVIFSPPGHGMSGDVGFVQRRTVKWAGKFEVNCSPGMTGPMRNRSGKVAAPSPE